MRELKVVVTEKETYGGFNCMRGYSIQLSPEHMLPYLLTINFVNTPEMSFRLTIREQIIKHFEEHNFKEYVRDIYDYEQIIDEVDKQIPRLQWREPFEHEKLGLPFKEGLTIEQVEAFNQKNSLGKLAGRK